VYDPLPYPDVLTKEGEVQANAAGNPVRKDCYSPNLADGPLIQPGVLPDEWTDLLGINTAPVGLLPASIPLLVVQGADDHVVPYDVTRAAAQDICASGVPVTFYKVQGGDPNEPGGGHNWPLDPHSVVANGDGRGQFVHKAILYWAQQVITGGTAENSCGSLPPD
jgi:fermentation-respiration switch protein FrsA (DUF1100 family)